jgi:hypothetical protein
VTLRGFWFTDRFETDCGYWQAFKSGQPAPPWTMVPSGLMQLDAGASSSTCLLTRYDATNIVLSSMVSCSQGTVGLVFRRRGGRYYLLAVNPAKNSARLLLVDGAETKQIGAAAEPAAVERAIGGLRRSAGAREAAGGALRHLLSLFVSAQGSRIRAGVNGQMLLDAEDETLTSGNVGFYANRARAVFHSLDAASPSPGP